MASTEVAPWWHQHRWHQWRNYGPAAAGAGKNWPRMAPFSNHIGRYRELGAHFWDPAGPEIWSYATEWHRAGINTDVAYNGINRDGTVMASMEVAPWCHQQKWHRVGINRSGTALASTEVVAAAVAITFILQCLCIYTSVEEHRVMRLPGRRRQTDSRMVGRLAGGWMEGWKDGWLDGWKDGVVAGDTE